MNFTFRSATIKDLDAVMKCEKDCFHSEERMSRSELTKISNYASRFRPELFLVATLANEVVGYVCCSLSHENKINEKALNNYEKEGKTVVCQSMCVSPSVQKTGVAKNLAKYWLGRVESTKKYHRIIFYGRKHLHKFYQDFGFICLGPSDMVIGPSPWMDFSKEL
ncbi:acyl-CoA N-acyltransferase [Sporodiniella umbellata]|nr:acyl-CoA N-acyltransferase [Sporodiniella umbellata]